MKHTIIIFYLYTDIQNPEETKVWIRSLCEKYHLTGRVLLATEGINATLEGTHNNIESFIQEYKTDSRFSPTVIKKSDGTGSAFPRLMVKVRPEIVSLGLKEKDVDPNITTGIHLKPEELHTWIRNKKDMYIVDMRNDYEWKLGRFKNSVVTSMQNFRELPEKIKEIEHLKNKTIVTVCTAGVRCEKASGFLKEQGFKDVYQLEGGIQTYIEKYKNDDFQGKMYVFDNRLVTAYTPDEIRTVIGRCDFCGTQSENCVNCHSLNCHKHHISCEQCIEKNRGVFCNKRCKIEHETRNKKGMARVVGMMRSLVNR